MTDVSAIAGAPAPGSFRVGLVLSRSFNILSRNVLKFLPLTAIMALPDLLGRVPGLAGGAARRDPDAVFTGAVIVGLLASLILWLFLYTLTEAVVLYGSFQAMRMRPVSIGESFQRGLSRVFPIVGLSICIGLAVVFASIALLVPGLMLLARWYVALPACVVERLGPSESMRRSAALTKGHRWKIFGIFLLITIINAIVGNVLHGALFAAGAPVVVAGTMIWDALIGAYQAIVVAVAYHDLRVAKEGVDIERIASVFD